MFKIIKIIIAVLLISGCSIKVKQDNIYRNNDFQGEYAFRILPIKVEETPDNWLFKNKFLETPFISFSDRNDTIAGVLYMPHGTYKVQGEVNIISGDRNISGHFPIMDCETERTEFNADIKLKPKIYAIFESICVKVKP